jgi:hypothetical protein
MEAKTTQREEKGGKKQKNFGFVTMNFEVVISFCDLFCPLGTSDQKECKRKVWALLSCHLRIELLAHNITPKNGSHSILLL